MALITSYRYILQAAARLSNKETDISIFPYSSLFNKLDDCRFNIFKSANYANRSSLRMQQSFANPNAIIKLYAEYIADVTSLLVAQLGGAGVSIRGVKYHSVVGFDGVWLPCKRKEEKQREGTRSVRLIIGSKYV